eukprot:m.322113 g.322113  ORF g.322113 m.322113 type:complete len:169 (+) comp16454_c0_seq102:2541-3047(+)
MASVSGGCSLVCPWTWILGLRVNGTRAIRAKYPNGNPELSGPDAVDVPTYQAGWVTHDTQWLPPNRSKWNETKDVVSNTTNWPGVNWPTSEENPIENEQEGEGDWGDFHIGHGGFCDDLDPPAGYWCSQNPPRGNCYNSSTQTSKGYVNRRCSVSLRPVELPKLTWTQ